MILASYLSSQRALKSAINQTDTNKIYDETPGGTYSRITAALNILAGVLFLIGVILISLFVVLNMRGIP
jgi:hypothetical protein